MSSTDLGLLDESAKAITDWIVARHRGDILCGLRRARESSQAAVTSREPGEYMNAVLERCVCSPSVRHKLISVIRRGDNTGAFLRRVAFLVGCEEIRQNAPIGIPLEDSDFEIAANPSSAGGGASGVDDLTRRAQQAMLSLPRSTRRIINERLKEGRSFKSIAKRTGRTPEEARSLFQEGIAALRSLLEL